MHILFHSVIYELEHGYHMVPTAQGKQGKCGGRGEPLSGKTQGIRKFCQNTGNLVCSSCQFPDSKGIQCTM